MTAIQGWVTAAIPAFLILTGYWRNLGTIAIALAVFGVVVFAALWPAVGRRMLPAEAQRPGEEIVSGQDDSDRRR